MGQFFKITNSLLYNKQTNSWVNALISVPRSSGLQACTHPPKDRKERAIREKEREGSTKGKGGLYKMPQNPTLTPKWPRSGVTFRFMIPFYLIEVA